MMIAEHMRSKLVVRDHSHRDDDDDDDDDCCSGGSGILARLESLIRVLFSRWEVSHRVLFPRGFNEAYPHWVTMGVSRWSV